MKIAVVVDGFEGWSGGVRLVELILSALESVTADHRLELFAIGRSDGNRILRNLVNRIYHNIASGSCSLRSIKTAFDIIPGSVICTQLRTASPSVHFVTYDGRISSLKRLINKYRIDILLPTSRPLYDLGSPWIGYLPDCQHHHHPELFASKDIVYRDKFFVRMLSCAQDVIVNARSVADDLNSFHQSIAVISRIHTLNFSPILSDESIFDAYSNSSSALFKYSVERGAYFIVSNQFWVHKDHSTAIRAFSIFLKNVRGCAQWKLICTGSASDPRSVSYYSELITLVDKLGLKSRLIFTGHIERAEQLSLMASAVAVIQPTRFEGGPGGGAVYDGIALGVPCLVSDIPVNREISLGRVAFFPVGDPIALADLMEKVEVRSGDDIASLINLNRARRKLLGQQLVSIASIALSGKSEKICIK
jgi:glycosyltransferase involved in cell wall biosynthesis